jgi:transglutaminase-like putative cysteine protease
MKRYIEIICLVFYLLFIFPSRVSAESQFRADYDVDYSINTQGVTIVTQKISLTNLETNIYPKQYSITLDTDKVRNIIAYDQKGMVNPVITQSDGKTVILLPFNEKVVGLGKKLNFSLRLENTDIAQKNGEIWEVNIPGISETSDLGEYNVTLETPPTFGKNAYIVPQPANGHSWNKAQMVSGGISAAYGEEQFFTVKLSYFLDNPLNSKHTAEIALPPDTAFQKVSIRSIEPLPASVIRDSDGNWLARYNMSPNTKLKITVLVTASLYIEARKDYGKEQIITDDYLKPTKYWNSSDPNVISLAQTYRTPEEIYNYVVRTLAYDYQRVNANPIRMGAVMALQEPKNAVCMEFTDAFIAIARAAGIPARQAVGFAYTTNTKLRPLSLVTDIMHAWPEYYDADRQLWIGIDPTWGNTTGGIDYFNKLDFNHIVFAINGKQDNYPYPAGAYRDTDKTGKFVDVSFADAADAQHLRPKLDTNVDFPGNVVAGLVTSGNIKIKNTTGVGINDIAINVRSNPEDIIIAKTIDHIPPFTTVNIPITFNTKSLLLATKGNIKVNVNGEITNFSFNIRPIYVLIAFILILILIGLGILWKNLSRKYPKT